MIISTHNSFYIGGMTGISTAQALKFCLVDCISRDIYEVYFLFVYYKYITTHYLTVTV